MFTLFWNATLTIKLWNAENFRFSPNFNDEKFVQIQRNGAYYETYIGHSLAKPYIQILMENINIPKLVPQNVSRVGTVLFDTKWILKTQLP